MISHRELLKKYIKEVSFCEGVTFIPKFPDDEITQEEIDELKKLANEQLPSQETKNGR